MAIVRQVVVPLLDDVTGKGIKRVTVAASLLALVGTGFLELGDAHASWNDLWCVAQAVGFGVAFTRIEVGARFSVFMDAMYRCCLPLAVCRCPCGGLQ